MKRTIGAVVAAAAIAFRVGMVVTAAPNAPDISGAIRCNAGVFEVISDSSHDPVGIDHVVTTSTYIDVYYSYPWAEIGSVQVTADETYTVNDYSFGASVGLTYTRILVAHSGVQVAPATACMAWSNIWISGWK